MCGCFGGGGDDDVGSGLHFTTNRTKSMMFDGYVCVVCLCVCLPACLSDTLPQSGITFADIAAAFGFNFSPTAGFEVEAEATVVFATMDSLLDATKCVRALAFATDTINERASQLLSAARSRRVSLLLHKLPTYLRCVVLRRYPPCVTGGALIMRSPSPYTGLTPAVMSSAMTASPCLSPMIAGDTTPGGTTSGM